MMDQEEVAFKMIHSNVSTVVGQLDSIRKKPRKFICLNDNIEHSSREAEMVKAVLRDFYETLFPLQSQFELPNDYRNRFTHVEELRQWQNQKERTTFWLRVALVALIFFGVFSFVSDQIVDFWRKHKYKFIRSRNPFMKIYRRCFSKQKKDNDNQYLI